MKKICKSVLPILFFFFLIQCTSSLVKATKEGDKNEVKLLLDKGADANDTDGSGKKAIALAADGGHIEIVKLLLDKGADPNEGIGDAACSGNIELVKLLLSKGANPDVGINDAAACGNKGIVQILLEKGASVNYLQGNLTPLARAAAGKKYNSELVQYLISYGADIKLATFQLEEYIMRLEVGKYKNTDTNRELIKQGKLAKNRIESINNINEPPFNATAENADSDTIPESTQYKSIKVRKYSGTEETIAVLDFISNDFPQSVALNISELIRTELVNTNKYIMIERAQIKEVLKEQGFQQTGCTETSCAVEIGKLLAAKKILVGSVMKMGTKMMISGRIVDVEKGIGERGATGKVGSLDEMDSCVVEFINNLLDDKG